MHEQGHHQHHPSNREHGLHHQKGSSDHAETGHDKHVGHSVAMFRNKFWLTLLLTVPTVLWSEMIQHWFGYT
jgi:P-type Cu2+ transporter